MKMPIAVGLLLSTAACSSLQPVLEPAAFFAAKQPEFVVVTTVEADEIDEPLVFLSPSIQGETLTGSVDGVETSLPMKRIRVLKATQKDRRKTTLAIVGGVVALGVFGMLVSKPGSTIGDVANCPPTHPCDDN